MANFVRSLIIFSEPETIIKLYTLIHLYFGTYVFRDVTSGWVGYAHEKHGLAQKKKAQTS